MKKLILLFIMMLGCISSTFAEVQWYRASSFAFARVYNGRYTWGDWENSDVNIKIDTNSDLIVIYSKTTQIYSVYDSYNNGNAYRDNNGGRQIKFYVIDQDYDRGTVRLRVENNGNSQLYVDFNDCAWCYNVRRIQ